MNTNSLYSTILRVKQGKKYFSFKCPHCGKPMRRQFIGAYFWCGSKKKGFQVKPKRSIHVKTRR